MTVSAQGQFELTCPAGTLLMGASTKFGLTQVGGLDAVDIATSDLPLLAGGVYAARDRKLGRTVSLDFKIVDRTDGAALGSLTACMGSLIGVWDTGVNTVGTLTYRWYGQTANRYMLGRPRRAKTTFKYDEYGFGYAVAAVDFFCEDGTIRTSSGGTVVTF